MPALVKHPLVDCDVEEAAIWYAQRDPLVADRFIDEARRAMLRAAAEPLRYLLVAPAVRRVRMKGFPQSVFYFILNEDVYILTVTHGARDLENLLRNRMPTSSTD